MANNSKYARLYPTDKRKREELKAQGINLVRRAVWLDPAGFDGAGSYTIDGKTLTRAEYIDYYGPLGDIDVISIKHAKGGLILNAQELERDGRLNR